ncbi:YeeE/YedE family protein [Denitratisoma sp. agr-D3]
MNAYFPLGLSQYLIGGLLIGLGVALLYLTTGRTGGLSTGFSTVWSWLLPSRFFRQTAFLQSRHWRLIYALGVVAGGALYAHLGLPLTPTELPQWKLIVGGLLIGFGARLGGGCTSGHGICGMASLSLGSLLMVLIFLSTGIATAWAFQWAGW